MSRFFMVQCVYHSISFYEFWHLKPFRSGSLLWQTKGKTDKKVFSNSAL